MNTGRHNILRRYVDYFLRKQFFPFYDVMRSFSNFNPRYEFRRERIYTYGNIYLRIDFWFFFVFFPFREEQLKEKKMREKKDNFVNSLAKPNQGRETVIAYMVR